VYSPSGNYLFALPGPAAASYVHSGFARVNKRVRGRVFRIILNEVVNAWARIRPPSPLTLSSIMGTRYSYSTPNRTAHHWQLVRIPGCDRWAFELTMEECSTNAK